MFSAHCALVGRVLCIVFAGGDMCAADDVTGLVS